MPAAPIKVLWIKDKRTGHINKAKGFLASLAKGPRPLEIETWQVRWRFSWVRHLVGRLSKTRITAPPSWLLKDFPPPGQFDLIISSGGLTQWPNTVMAKRLGVPNIYLGSPHHFPPEAFTLVPLTDPPHDRPPFLKLDLISSEVSPDSVREAARRHFGTTGETGWTLLLGGDGEGLKWSYEDFMRLAGRFLEEASKAGQPTFISTSRRTPERVELALRERCSTQEGFVCGAWFHATEETAVPLLALLGRSNRIFVTADSVSMTYEAVASGVPAVAVYPTKGVANRRHEAQFQVLESNGALTRIQLEGTEPLAAVQPAGGWRLVTDDRHAELATRALQRLGLGNV